MSLLSIGDQLDIVLSFLGFCPSRFALRQSCGILLTRISQFAIATEEEFLDVWQRRWISLKCPQLSGNEISRKVVERLVVESRPTRIVFSHLQTIFQNRTSSDLCDLSDYEIRRLSELSLRYSDFRLWSLFTDCLAERGDTCPFILSSQVTEFFNTIVPEERWMRKALELLKTPEGHWKSKLDEAVYYAGTGDAEALRRVITGVDLDILDGGTVLRAAFERNQLGCIRIVKERFIFFDNIERCLFWSIPDSLRNYKSEPVTESLETLFEGTRDYAPFQEIIDAARAAGFSNTCHFLMTNKLAD